MKNHTKVERSEVAQVVVSCLEKVLSEIGKGSVDGVGESTYITGDRSVLDSLGSLTLLTDLEKRLEEDYGLRVTLVDDRASQKNSPLRTVRSLTDHIYGLLDETSYHDQM